MYYNTNFTTCKLFVVYIAVLGILPHTYGHAGINNPATDNYVPRREVKRCITISHKLSSLQQLYHVLFVDAPLHDSRGFYPGFCPNVFYR